MYHATYARLKTGSQPSRLERLIKALEAEKCRVRLDLVDGFLNVEIPDERMWWVLTGCITIFFEDYKDVADWSFKFNSAAPSSLTA